MKTLAFVAAAILATSASSALAAGAAGDAQPTRAAAPAGPAAAEKTAVIPVKGMTCGGCVEHVNGALGKLKGVKSVNTDLEKERTTVVFDPAQVKPQQIAAAITEAGYKPGKPQVK
jgi:copper ion binding protein